MNVTAHDQMNQHRTITFRAPSGAIDRALAHYDGFSWRVSRSTADRIARFAHRIAIATDDGPLHVLVAQDGPDQNDWVVMLKP